MHTKLRAFLRANGLKQGAPEQDAWKLYDDLKGRGIIPAGMEIGTRSPEFITGGEPESKPAVGAAAPVEGARAVAVVGMTQANVDSAIATALQADGARRSEVEGLLDVAGFIGQDDSIFRRSLLDNTQMDSARASQAILQELKKRNIPFGIGAQSGASVGIEAGDKLRAAVRDGLGLRLRHNIEKPADGARDFRSRSLVEVCREMLEVTGVSTRGMSNMQIAGRALASGSTSDFPSIFSGLVSTTLLAAYNEWPSTWRPFVAITSAQNFKDIHAVKLSGAPDLKGLGENGEYQTAKFSDAKESYRVITKGIKVPLTRQMIIDDDLRAFERIPQLFGAAARRMEGDAVYSLITSNAKMADGKELFHAFHKNLAASGAALGDDPLRLARAAMRKQTGLGGAVIDATPAFLLTSVDEELNAETLLRSTALPKENMSAGVHNPWAGKLTPVADPHLDGTAWYLLAHPNQVPCIEAAYLEGEEQPYVEEQIDFNSDALVIKVRHDFGAGIVDHVGAYKNPGVA